MIAIVLIAGLTLVGALCVGALIAPSLRTLTVSTLDQSWPYLASFSAIYDTAIETAPNANAIVQQVKPELSVPGHGRAPATV